MANSPVVIVLCFHPGLRILLWITRNVKSWRDYVSLAVPVLVLRLLVPLALPLLVWAHRKCFRTHPDFLHAYTSCPVPIVTLPPSCSATTLIPSSWYSDSFRTPSILLYANPQLCQNYPLCPPEHKRKAAFIRTEGLNVQPTVTHRYLHSSGDNLDPLLAMQIYADITIPYGNHTPSAISVQVNT